jgi:hypothetical protein
MTFEELENTLPNGFHDAKIVRITLDFPDGNLLMNMQILVDSSKHGNEQYALAELRAGGLFFCFIDPPDPTYPFRPNGKALRVSGAPESTESRAIEDLLARLPEGITAYRFFADQWNSFIHVAASDIGISWSKHPPEDGS